MPAIWLQLTQSGSIVRTCIPSLKRVLADLQTGMMAGVISEFFELSVSGGQHNPTDGSAARDGRGRIPYTAEPDSSCVANTIRENADASRNGSSRTLLGDRNSANFERRRGSPHIRLR